MEILAENEGKVYRATSIQSPDAFAAPPSSAAFPCLIWDHEGQFTDADRSIVAKALLESGCHYVVCAGIQPEAWENTVDMEYVDRHFEDTEAESRRALVMTTSHEGESEEDLRWYALDSEFGYVLEPKPPVVVWMTHNAATCSIEFLQLG